MTRLRWRDAEHKDRAALQDFICTPPVPQPRKFGRGAPPRDLAWELEAQSAARALQPPAHENNIILVGEDELGIVAVAHAEADGNFGVAFVAVMAVALRARRHRSSGDISPTVGEQLMDELINRLSARADAAGYDHLELWGFVSRRNTASKALCARSGANHIEHTDEFDKWVNRIDFA